MKAKRQVIQLLLGLLLGLTARAAEEPGRIEGVIGSAAGPVSNAWVFVYSAAPREGRVDV